EMLKIMFPNGLTESEEEWMYGEMLKTPTEVAIAMLGAVAGTDLRPLLSGLKLPVLLVNGTRSAVPYDVGGWLQDHLQDRRRLLLDIFDVRLRVRDPEAELLLLRHQLRVVRRQVKRPQLDMADRTIMAALSRRLGRASLVGMLVQPEAVIGSHRELVRRKWAA